LARGAEAVEIWRRKEENELSETLSVQKVGMLRK